MCTGPCALALLQLLEPVSLTWPTSDLMRELLAANKLTHHLQRPPRAPVPARGDAVRHRGGAAGVSMAFLLSKAGCNVVSCPGRCTHARSVGLVLGGLEAFCALLQYRYYLTVSQSSSTDTLQPVLIAFSQTKTARVQAYRRPSPHCSLTAQAAAGSVWHSTTTSAMR